VVTQTELYRFTEKDSTTKWTYTSGDESVIYNAGSGNETYTPISISRSDIEQRKELSRADLDIRVSLTNPAAIHWLQDNGELLASLTIFKRNKQGIVSTIWKGRLVGVIPGMEDITLKFESVFTSLRRPGLRARYQKSCRHPLYGKGCNLNPEDFATVASCTAASGTVLTVTEAGLQPAGYYTGGMLRTDDGVLSYIVSHAGEQIVIQRMSYNLSKFIILGFPFTVKIYPGCAHDRATCNTKFNNKLNYGGFDFIPLKNPMGGSSIV